MLPVELTEELAAEVCDELGLTRKQLCSAHTAIKKAGLIDAIPGQRQYVQ